MYNLLFPVSSTFSLFFFYSNYLFLTFRTMFISYRDILYVYVRVYKFNHKDMPVCEVSIMRKNKVAKRVDVYKKEKNNKHVFFLHTFSHFFYQNI